MARLIMVIKYLNTLSQKFNLNSKVKEWWNLNLEYTDDDNKITSTEVVLNKLRACIGFSQSPTTLIKSMFDNISVNNTRIILLSSTINLI